MAAAAALGWQLAQFLLVKLHLTSGGQMRRTWLLGVSNKHGASRGVRDDLHGRKLREHGASA
jgi:hypothetical protein